MIKAFLDAPHSGKITYEIRLNYAGGGDAGAVDAILAKIGSGVKVKYIGSDGYYCFVYEK